ncbi:MAG: RIO1 family regulatory kinase/ATPase [Nakamurella sp.]
MPRFRITTSTYHQDDLDDAYDDLHTRFDEPRPTRRRDNRIGQAPRVVLEGKSGRLLVDADQADEPDQELGTAGDAGRFNFIEQPYSSYDVATHGPDPVPDWVITSLDARDTKLGVIKSGKEADVSLLDRSLTQGPGCLLAVKTFRGADHRMFHRDAGYQEGRRIKRSRETRAMAARTKFGRELLAGQWAGAEFAALSSIWKLGAKVPYPVQLIGSELMMEFIGDPDGTAAPRLAAYSGSTADFTELFHDLVSSLEVLAQSGLTHGDLSPYNVLVADNGCVVIDLPQVVDLVANPQGEQFLRRDCQNIAGFFARKGVLAADAELLELHLGGLAVP